MIKAAVLGLGLVTVISTAAAAQPYYPYYAPGYGYPAYSYPSYTSAYTYPSYSYPYGYAYYGTPYYPYYYSGYRPAPYSDPYVAQRPYSDKAGPAASGHTGY